MSEATGESVAARGNGVAPLVDGKKRQFTDEFKRMAVARVKKGENPTHVAEALTLSPSVVRRWIAEGGGAVKEKTTKPTARKGVSIGPSGRKIYTDQFIRSAVARIARGESPKEIAKELKLNTSMLFKWRARVGKSKAAPKSKAATPRYNEEVKAQAVLRVERGEDIVEVAREMGMNKGSIYSWMNGKAKRKPKEIGPAHVTSAHGVRECAGLLRLAKTAAYEMLRSGEITEFDQAHLLMQSALKALLKSE